MRAVADHIWGMTFLYLPAQPNMPLAILHLFIDRGKILGF